MAAKQVWLCVTKWLSVMVFVAVLGGCGADPNTVSGLPTPYPTATPIPITPLEDADDLKIATTTAWLAAAIAEIVGTTRLSELVMLQPPGACPGHFDFSPGKVQALRGCTLLLRHDFQYHLDRRIEGLDIVDLLIVPIYIGEGLAIPSVYEEALQDVTDILVARYPAGATEFVYHLNGAQSRLRRLEREIEIFRREYHLHMRRVVASQHQAAFCQWLGLEVAATFGGAENMSAAGLRRLLQQARQSGVVCVVGNGPEGTQMPQSVAEKLGVPVVMFENFPPDGGHYPVWEQLLRINVTRLQKIFDK